MSSTEREAQRARERARRTHIWFNLLDFPWVLVVAVHHEELVAFLAEGAALQRQHALLGLLGRLQAERFEKSEKGVLGGQFRVSGKTRMSGGSGGARASMITLLGYAAGAAARAPSSPAPSTGKALGLASSGLSCRTVAEGKDATRETRDASTVTSRSVSTVAAGTVGRATRGRARAESQQSTINQKSETSEWFQKRNLIVDRRGVMPLASP